MIVIKITIGSIGGGNLENCYGRSTIDERDHKEKYDLSNAQSATLGMICGGEMKYYMFQYKKTEKTTQNRKWENTI